MMRLDVVHRLKIAMHAYKSKDGTIMQAVQLHLPSPQS